MLMNVYYVADTRVRTTSMCWCLEGTSQEVQHSGLQARNLLRARRN